MNNPTLDRPAVRTWPYGTTRKATVMEVIKGRKVTYLLVSDEEGEGHWLAGCGTGKKGDTGTITFTKGGPTGGYWQFTVNEREQI